MPDDAEPTATSPTGGPLRSARSPHRPFLLPALVGAILLGVGVIPTASAHTGPDEPVATAVPTDTVTAVRYVDASLRSVLADVETRTGVHFLYRDALIAGVRVTLRTSPDGLLDALADALRRNGLTLQLDRSRQQGIVLRADAPSHPAVLAGQIVDAEAGTRLPRATLTWEVDGRRTGTAADDQGNVRVRLSESVARRDTLVLTASYVGYEPQTVRISPRRPPADLSVRLSPRETMAPEVVVRSLSLQSDLDTTWQSLLQPERYSAVGESSVLSALQTLPSVGVSPALSGELIVRGSRGDGFHVLLDGISIYNQNHFFGLFDAFNADALQTVGLFTGVAPAEYPAPPGGTVAFQTRSGSHADVRLSAHASPTAVSATAEGPLGDGRGSWLVSARHSILGMGGLGNDDLIGQGLGVDRATGPTPANVREIDRPWFRPGPPSARFFDVHATAEWESTGRHRWSLSTYAGGDAAEQGGERLSIDADPTFRERFLNRDVVDTTAVETSDRWGNVGASLRWRAPMGGRAVSDLTAALSRYYSRYETDDFLYVRPRLRQLSAFYGAFRNDNELLETSLTHRVVAAASSSLTWTGGYAARVYDVTYEEQSAVLPLFDGSQQSLQTDAFAQADIDARPVDLHLGARVHYFSQGAYLRISPRVQMRVGDDRPVSVGAGYSRNHQFLHRLELVNDVSSPVWVPSTAEQPPSTVDHVTAGIYATPTRSTALQVEGYWKNQRNVRLHETVTRLRRTDDSVLLNPWSVENDALARGIEVLARQRIGPVSATAAYTLSRADVTPADGSGTRPADWDRRHQVTTRIAWSTGDRASAHATWTLASGAPNAYNALLDRFEPDRLGPYHRLDLGATVHGSVGAVEWTLRGSVFNAYDRDNPWYRDPVPALRPDGFDRDDRPDLGFALVDVYDLGIRPSLSVSVRW